MVTLNLDEKPGLRQTLREGGIDLSDSRIPLVRVVVVVLAIAGWLWGWFGGPGSTAVAKDYVSVRDRVTTLEVQRAEDVRAREKQATDDKEWRARVDRKLDDLFDLMSKGALAGKR